jgi:hypothetical protein
VRAEPAVQLRVDDARLDVDLQIRAAHRHDARHARAVEHDAAADGDRVALEARARAARRERHARVAARANHLDDLVRRERPHHGVGAMRRLRRRVVRGRVEIGGARRAALAEPRAETGDHIHAARLLRRSRKREGRRDKRPVGRGGTRTVPPVPCFR